MRIGVIGTGVIATAMVRGIAGDGHQITVSARGAVHAAALTADFANVAVADNQAVLDRSEVVFLGLVAGAAPAILRALAFRPDQQVITLMAGMSLAEVAEIVSPARAAALMLPFPGIAQGGSPILALGDATLIQTLFAPRNSIHVLKDAQELTAYVCAQAVLSPVARMVGDAARWLAARSDDQAQGEAFLRALVASSLGGTPSAQLIDALNTEGGYNQRLRLHMDAAGMGEVLIRGLDMLEQGG